MTARMQLWQGVSYTYYIIYSMYLSVRVRGQHCRRGQNSPNEKAAADKIGLPSSEYSETSEFSEKRWQLS